MFFFKSNLFLLTHKSICWFVYFLRSTSKIKFSYSNPSNSLPKGECGIKIRNIGFEKSGTWKCEVLRKQRPGSTVLGSEVTSSSIKVDVFRTSRLNDDELELQVFLFFGPNNIIG